MTGFLLPEKNSAMQIYFRMHWSRFLWLLFLFLQRLFGFLYMFNGKLGFEKIYQTPCDIFCNIIYMGNPVFAYEETANVFDRPTIIIFKKVKVMDENTYKLMLQ